MRKLFTAFFVITIFLAGQSLFGETLEEILAKNYQARGGIEKLKSIKTMYIEGKIVIPAQGMEMPIKMWQKRPNKMRTETTLQGKTIVQAYNGQKAWWIMPFMGTGKPQEMPETQAKQFKEQAESMDPLIYYKERGYKLEYVGKEEVEGTEVYTLKLIRKDGRVVYHYLDTETGIEIKTMTYIKRGESDLKVETEIGDYKPVKGIMMPFSIASKVNGKLVSQIVFEKIELNLPLQDSMFDMPASEKAEK